MPEPQDPWWNNPQGLMAALTIASMILAFFYIREKQLWDVSARMFSVEKDITTIKEEVNSFQRKIDQIENKDLIDERTRLKPKYR